MNMIITLLVLITLHSCDTLKPISKKTIEHREFRFRQHEKQIASCFEDKKKLLLIVKMKFTRGEVGIFSSTSKLLLKNPQSDVKFISSPDILTVDEKECFISAVTAIRINSSDSRQSYEYITFEFVMEQKEIRTKYLNTNLN